MVGSCTNSQYNGLILNRLKYIIKQGKTAVMVVVVFVAVAVGKSWLQLKKSLQRGVSVCVREGEMGGGEKEHTCTYTTLMNTHAGW